MIGIVSHDEDLHAGTVRAHLGELGADLVQLDTGSMPSAVELTTWTRPSGYWSAEWGLYGIDGTGIHARVHEMLDLFELRRWEDELVESFSHGMKQRLVMSAAFLHRPRAVAVDEPMVGLDPRGARLIKEVFRRMSERGVAILMSTHTLEVAQEMCHRVSIINKGRIVAQDTRKVDQIRVEGLERVNEEVVIQSMETTVGSPLDVATLDLDMRRIYGRGDFEHVGYKLIDDILIFAADSRHELHASAPAIQSLNSALASLVQILPAADRILIIDVPDLNADFFQFVKGLTMMSQAAAEKLMPSLELHAQAEFVLSNDQTLKLMGVIDLKDYHPTTSVHV